MELDCREVRVCPLPEAEEESPDDVDIAEERYVGGNCGGGTICAPPMPNTDPPSTDDVTAACGFVRWSYKKKRSILVWIKIKCLDIY